MRRRDPEITAAEMARELGVSKQNVREHLVALGLPTTTTRSDRLRGPRSPETDAAVVGQLLPKLRAALREQRAIEQRQQKLSRLLADILKGLSGGQ
jgi:predicted transcriptional regulator